MFTVNRARSPVVLIRDRARL